MLKKATRSDLSVVAELAARLWPEQGAEELKKEFAPMLEDADCAVFLLYEAETPIGFAQCGLRRDYVEGTESSPVGYLEGIYVEAGYRRKGYARLLLTACEVWAKEKNCAEFASDCELENEESLHFHRNVGFEEANRIICFVKSL